MLRTMEFAIDIEQRKSLAAMKDAPIFPREEDFATDIEEERRRLAAMMDVPIYLLKEEYVSNMDQSLRLAVTKGVSMPLKGEYVEAMVQ